jgi:hypothetical protein
MGKVLRSPVARASLGGIAAGNEQVPPAYDAASRTSATSRLTALVPSPLSPIYDYSSGVHRFPIRFDELGADLVPTRSLVKPVQQNVDFKADTFVRLAAAGAVATAITRAALQPLEVQKTLAQATNAGDEAEASASGKTRRGSAAQKDVEHDDATPEGLTALLSPELWRGVDATAVTGAIQGASSFAAYEGARQYIPRAANALLGPAASTAYADAITLASAGTAVLVAVLCFAPFEAARVRSIVSKDERGIVKTLQTIIEEGGVGKLWASAAPLMARELPFVGTKLVVYGQAQAAFFNLLPAAREREELALFVALASGFTAGATAAVVSQPSDTVATKLLAGEDVKLLLQKPPRELADALFAGTVPRATQFGVILMVQFLLFDYVRFLLNVSPDDLSLTLDVFADRLSFYEIK